MNQINKLLIVGVGLIGGSLALALRRAGVVNEIVGAGRNEVNLKKAIELDVIDRYSLNFAEEVSGSDVIVVATPVLAMNSIFEMIAATDYRDTIITDVGSVKKQILQFAERHLDSSYTGFVPAHPIAGTEHSGVEAARVDLFDKKRTLVTPTENTNSEAVDVVTNMWLTAGSVVGTMDVAFHDTILSACSHLPHLAAFGLVHYIHDHENRQECFDLAASGFYDFTRIASSDPVMWSDICSANAGPILQELNGYIAKLQAISNSLSAGNIDDVQAIFQDAKSSRDYHFSRFPR